MNSLHRLRSNYKSFCLWDWCKTKAFSELGSNLLYTAVKPFSVMLVEYVSRLFYVVQDREKLWQPPARAGDACKKNGARKKEILNSFFGFCTAKWKIKMNSATLGISVEPYVNRVSSSFSSCFLALFLFCLACEYSRLFSPSPLLGCFAARSWKRRLYSRAIFRPIFTVRSRILEGV